MKTKGDTVIELTDQSSEHSNSAQSRADSEECIIRQAQAPPRQDGGVRIETTFVSSVEFCQQEDFRPTVPRGLGQNDGSNYVTSVSHTN